MKIDDNQEYAQGVRQGVLLYLGAVCDIIDERTPRPLGELMSEDI